MSLDPLDALPQRLLAWGLYVFPISDLEAQVRPLTQDKVFGRPSAPDDFAYQTPELLGSERTGPDLTNDPELSTICSLHKSERQAAFVTVPCGSRINFIGAPLSKSA
jgi:hypothetical protein